MEDVQGEADLKVVELEGLNTQNYLKVEVAETKVQLQTEFEWDPEERVVDHVAGEHLTVVEETGVVEEQQQQQQRQQQQQLRLAVAALVSESQQIHKAR